MKTDIILAGVGGQGILSIAAALGSAALTNNLYMKQAETHGMSQRGGDVQSFMRISDQPIYSDLIRKGDADLIISMEPMEALRYVGELDKGGCVVTSSQPFKNIPNYPSEEALEAEVNALPRCLRQPIEELAKAHSMPKSANIILLGMAAKYIEILSAEQLRESVGRVFASKGEQVIEVNLRAFDLGVELVGKE